MVRSLVLESGMCLKYVCYNRELKTEGGLRCCWGVPWFGSVSFPAELRKAPLKTHH